MNSLSSSPFLPIPSPVNTQIMSSISSISLFFILLFLITTTATGDNSPFKFKFQGFTAGSNQQLNVSGDAKIKSTGLLQLTNDTQREVGYAFYPIPIPNLTNSSSFTTTFVFAIVPKYSSQSGHGMTFALTPSVTPNGSGGHNLGLFQTNGSSNDTVAVEFDTFGNDEEHIQDKDGNHVGIDINSLNSVDAATPSYVSDEGDKEVNLSLASGDPMQVWIDYVGEKRVLSVTIAPLFTARPKKPLLETPLDFDLWSQLSTEVFVGFSAASASGTSSHYVLGWSFALDGEAEDLDLNSLPPVPRWDDGNGISNLLVMVLSILAAVVVILFIVGLVIVVRKRRKRFEEILEDWEVEYGPHRFSYRNLYNATDGFKKENVVGGGGFGLVYKGVLTKSQGQPQEVAVKRVHHDSRQGMKEFVAEIASMGRLRHRNLVQLLGYCRRRDALLLVYDYMSNGSLDKYLFAPENFTSLPVLTWRQRFDIIKGVASGLLYLHEGWEQVVVHRDIKAGNVLLDRDFNGKLSDFGLARLYDRGSNPQTTCVVGTFGYLAPELTKTGKATTRTDVYAFGSLLLEVVCGRRPMDSRVGIAEEESVLVDWALECWKRGVLLKVVDRKLKGVYDVAEVEMVLQLGLLCSHPEPTMRPSIREVVEILDGDVPLKPMSPANLSEACLAVRQHDGFDELAMSSFLPVTTTSEIMSESGMEMSPIKLWVSNSNSTGSGSGYGGTNMRFNTRH